MARDDSMADRMTSADIAKIRLAVRAGLPISITTYTLPHDMEIYMGEVLAAFLTELGQHHMIQYLQYCQNELIVNAKKANTKRIYFREKGLDIMNAADYRKGMRTFRDDTLSNIGHYLLEQRKAGLYVHLILQMRDNKIRLEVRNNSVITAFEHTRIHDKLMRARRYSSIDKAIADMIDDTEGAGLGLIIMVHMLEKLGLTEENFQTLCKNGETVTRIILPLSGRTQKGVREISESFVSLIENLPQFPENIAKLNRMLCDPNSRMSEIAELISGDAALAGELLRQVNSAAFALSAPCGNIADAVKLAGLRGIRNLLCAAGAARVFQGAAGGRESLRAHARKVAFYSYNIARNFCRPETAPAGDAYTCGLLHDMGKIIFETANPDFSEQMKRVCAAKGLPPELFERLAAGVNHGEAGALLAEKWNFPAAVTGAIRWHHNPAAAPESCKRLAAVVYLADIMAHYEDDEAEFYQIDPAVLSEFNIANEIQFGAISDRLRLAFNDEARR